MSNLSHPFAPTLAPIIGDDTKNVVALPHPDLPWSTTHTGRALVTDIELQVTQQLGPGRTRIIMAEATHHYYRFYLQFCLVLRHQPKSKNYMPRIVALSTLHPDALRALRKLQEHGLCRVIVHLVPATGVLDLAVIRPLITANTVLLTCSILAHSGHLLDQASLDSLCATALSSYQTPVHCDASLALAHHTHNHGGFLSQLVTQLSHVQVLTADLSYSCLLDAQLTFIREPFGTNYRLDFNDWRENPAAAAFLYKYLSFCRQTTTSPLAPDAYFLATCRTALPDVGIFTYAQYHERGHLGTAIVTLNDVNVAAGWLDRFLALVLLRQGKPVPATTVQQYIADNCDCYAHAINLTGVVASPLDDDPLLAHVVLLTATHPNLTAALAACLS